MIALTVATLFQIFGGSSTTVPGMDILDWMKDRFEKNIPDESRREKALEIVEGMEETLEEVHEESQELGEEFADLNRRHDSSREEFNRLFEKLDSTWKKKQDRILAHQGELKKALSKDEWNRVFAR